MTRLQRLVLGHGVAATAMAMPWPVLLALTWDRTHSHTWLAVVGAARMAPYVALSWAAGSLGDRISRTTVVRLSAQVRAALLVGATALGLADTVMVTGALVGAGLAPWLSVVVGPRLLFVSLAVILFLVAPAQVSTDSDSCAPVPHPPGTRTTEQVRGLA